LSSADVFFCCPLLLLSSAVFLCWCCPPLPLLSSIVVISAAGVISQHFTFQSFFFKPLIQLEHGLNVTWIDLV
jgi:hypothetical protein